MKRGRRLGFGLSTLFGGPALGWFIPYRYASGVVPAGYPALEPLFADALPAMEDVLAKARGFEPCLRAIDGLDGLARFNQNWFAPLDAVSTYTLVRSLAPARIVEIGSGHSTRFMARAVSDGALQTAITCIDPAPRAPIHRLNIRHVPSLLADIDPAILSDLEAGDILFIDSSHIAMPGSDVDRLILDVVPRLPSGTLLHVHDICLPDGYPPDWAWRGYNEQLVIGAMLLGGGFDIVFASHWLQSRHSERVAWIAALPGAGGAHASLAPATNLWLRKA